MDEFVAGYGICKRKNYVVAVACCAIGLLGGLLIYASGGSTTGLAIGAPIVCLCLVRLRACVKDLRKRYFPIEIYDYCVIDTKYFKDWVHWGDVQEIIAVPPLGIFLRVEDEDRFVRPPPNTVGLCNLVNRLVGHPEGLPKLALTPLGRNCSFAELYKSVRRASTAYGIPVRRIYNLDFDELAVPAPARNSDTIAQSSGLSARADGLGT